MGCFSFIVCFNLLPFNVSQQNSEISFKVIRHYDVVQLGAFVCFTGMNDLTFGHALLFILYLEVRAIHSRWLAVLQVAVANVLTAYLKLMESTQ